MNWDEAVRQLRANHAGAVHHYPGGHGWTCSCGRHGWPGTGYPSEAQAQARLDRHLRAQLRRLLA